MAKIGLMIKITLVLALVVIVGCQDRVSITEPQTRDLGIFGLPGVTLDSAVFSIYVGAASGQTINVHRVTSNWLETTVTYNNFGGAFDPAVVGSFVAGSIGWASVDVSPLVQGWIDGVFPNYGILIEQGATPGTAYASSEYANAAIHPMLKICYTTGGGSQCVTMQEGFNGVVPDAFISELYINDNYGSLDRLFTGIVYGVNKQSLLYFDMPTFPDLASIGDFVWCDDNGDGLQDLAEAGIEGVTVHLMDCGGNILNTDVTNASGYYLFDELEPGNYNIHFVLPDGYLFTLQNQGLDDAVDSDADVTTGMTACTTLDEGEIDLTWDAGLICPVPDSGCTRTIGYWKTHAGFGPQADVVTPLLPIWLGTAGGTKSINVTTAAIAVDILSQDVFGTPENGITKLYAQLLGAKLNGEAGAELTDVAAVIAAADAFLANNDWNDWDSLSESDQNMVLGWHDMLDDYNNGLIGPEHCD
jgi:hypothetical protein